jgi:pilus assembly protein CpaB
MAKKSGAGGIILAAVILGLIAIYLIWNLERKREMQAKKYWTQVVVAVQDIPARSKITREMVTLTSYPKELIAAGAITDPKQVEGRLTLTRIRTKDQIRSSDLAGEGQNNGLVYEIPTGMRAIAIQAGEVMAVGTAVKPGDRVDILATYTDPNTRQETTQMILQNVLVLAVNKGETDSQSKGGGANSSMTLAVKPEEAELLTAADRAGALRVALRGVQDKTIIASTGVGARDFQGRRTFEMSAQPPDEGRSTSIIIKPPPGGQRNEIKIYRGTQVQTVPSE